ncbi:cytochrome P450 [Bradyrhizobium macuxiense]|uniref:Cytochrome P450 n=1 Tax=Bradyrhizobium macuxiense TaxID=1755647 RepID=A0A560KXC7_9BRAD|nr:cytochrome P450 [Bradyrhizobium macuxiense]TWB87769.1 cytochrome P450 [Bradyrhizobium macuxiense]
MNLIEGHLAIDPPSGVPVWDIDPYDPAILSDPREYYAELRSKGPFAYIPRYSILACGRYGETKEVFSDWSRFVSSRGVGILDLKFAAPFQARSIIIDVDPPYHAKTRTVLARAMSPRAVAELKEKFREDAERLVDSLIGRGTFDAVQDLAEVFPTNVFPRAAGLKETDRRRLIDYGAMVFNAIGPENDLRRKAMKRVEEILPWVMERTKRDMIEPETFGATIYAAADEGEITEQEAGMLVRALLGAGIDTTVTGIGNALWCLGQNPDAFELLKEDPNLARPAFEETLRYTSPVSAFYRTANCDTEVSGTRIVEGSKILCVLGSANLDESHWPNADRFDIRRRPFGHLALGTGIHGCVGQNVARAEVDAVLTAIARKVNRIEFAGEAVWRPNNAMHALDRMPMTFVPN